MPYFSKGKLLLRSFLGSGDGRSGLYRFNTKGTILILLGVLITRIVGPFSWQMALQKRNVDRATRLK
jgi:hypothetical protein